MADTNQNHYTEVFKFLQPVATIVGALIAGGVGILAAWWRWKLDGRAQFMAVTADHRCRLDEARAAIRLPEYFTESVPILRQAVYRVRPFAKDWNGLESAWHRYESERRDEFEPIGDFVRRAPFDTPRTDDDRREAYERLRDYLDEFDRHVA